MQSMVDFSFASVHVSALLCLVALGVDGLSLSAPALYHSPRQHPGAHSFRGIRELHDYRFSDGSDRHVVHKVEHPSGFLLQYEALLQQGMKTYVHVYSFSCVFILIIYSMLGVYHIDLDQNVLNIMCSPSAPGSPADGSLVNMYAADPDALYAALSSSRFLVGDHQWSCESGIYNYSRAEPLHRRIDHVELVHDAVVVKTQPVPMIQLFEKASVKLHIPPRMEQSASAANTDGSAVEVTTDDYYVYAYSTTYEYGANYNADTDSATVGMPAC